MQSRSIDVRHIQPADLPDLKKYFFESPPEFLRSIGLKPMLPAEAADFDLRWQQRFADRQQNPIPCLTVFLGDERVGVHSSTHYQAGHSLIMHAHFFRSDRRGQGIGTISYVKALDIFFGEFGLQEILFKTPRQNRAPMRIKEKLGLLPIAEEVIDWPALIAPLETHVFRVTPDQMPELRRRADSFASR